MASRIKIFDHFAKPLVELSKIPTTPRSWVLNKYGMCEFTVGYNYLLPQSVQICREHYFQYGNLVHIEHLPSTEWTLEKRGKLPDWTGIILPPRDWDSGKLHVTIYGIEALLQFRAMPYTSVHNLPDSVFKEILQFVNAKAKNIVIQPGTIDNVPFIFTDDLKTTAYSHILKLINDASMDWNILGKIATNGSLELFANLYKRRGIDTGFLLTNTNTELASPLLTEQGTPFNHIFAHSQASTPNDRFMREAINQGSYDDYGPLQINQVLTGKHDIASVTNAGKSRVENLGRPSKLFRRIALDIGKTFNYLDIGNTLQTKDIRAGFHPNGGYGFESQIRIIGMDYNDMTKKVPLQIEVL